MARQLLPALVESDTTTHAQKDKSEAKWRTRGSRSLPARPHEVEMRCGGPVVRQLLPAWAGAQSEEKRLGTAGDL